jgi:hypothetical protein
MSLSEHLSNTFFFGGLRKYLWWQRRRLIIAKYTFFLSITDLEPFQSHQI